MTNKEIASTILNQLGGNKFIVMTGSKNFVAIDNGIRMTLTRNASKANRLEIKLNGDDTYTMRFYRYTPFRMNKKTFTMIDDKVTEIETFENVYCDNLQNIFVNFTSLYVVLF